MMLLFLSSTKAYLRLMFSKPSRSSNLAIWSTLYKKNSKVSRFVFSSLQTYPYALTWHTLVYREYAKTDKSKKGSSNINNNASASATSSPSKAKPKDAVAAVVAAAPATSTKAKGKEKEKPVTLPSPFTSVPLPAASTSSYDAGSASAVLDAAVDASELAEFGNSYDSELASAYDSSEKRELQQQIWKWKSVGMSLSRRSYKFKTMPVGWRNRPPSLSMIKWSYDLQLRT
jgi:hypothetical protein